MRKQIEAARTLALVFVDDHLGGDEAAKRAVVSFGADARGQQTASMETVGLVVTLTVAAIVSAFLLPIGIQELAGADLGENASEGAEALWNILDMIVVLSLFLAFIAVALSATNRI